MEDIVVEDAEVDDEAGEEDNEFIRARLAKFPLIIFKKLNLLTLYFFFFFIINSLPCYQKIEHLLVSIEKIRPSFVHSID